MPDKKELNPSPKIPVGEKPELSPNPNIKHEQLNKTDEKPNGGGRTYPKVKPTIIKGDVYIENGKLYVNGQEIGQGGGGGTDVEGNPTIPAGATTEDLLTIKIGEDYFTIPTGGSGTGLSVVELTGTTGQVDSEELVLLSGDSTIIKYTYSSDGDYGIFFKHEMLYSDGNIASIRYKKLGLASTNNSITNDVETIQITSSRDWSYAKSEAELIINSTDTYTNNQDLENIVLGDTKYLNRTIIDVTTLPTTNIKADKLYRTPSVVNGYKYDDEPVSSRTYYRIISTSQVTVGTTDITFITSQGTYTVNLGSDVSTEITPQFTIANLIAQAVGQNLIATVGDELSSSFATATVPSGTYIDLPNTITSYSEDSNIYYRDTVKNEWVSLLESDGIKVITLVSDTGTLTADQLELAKTNNCVIVYMNEVYYKDSYFASNPPTVGHILYRTTHNETSALGTNNETIVRNRYIQINWDTGAYTNEAQEILEANATIPSGTTANDLTTIKVGTNYYNIPDGVKKINLTASALHNATGTVTQEQYNVLNSDSEEAVIILTVSGVKYLYRKDSVDANGVLRYSMAGINSTDTNFISYSIFIDTNRNFSTRNTASLNLSWYGYGSGNNPLLNTLGVKSSASNSSTFYSIEPIIQGSTLPLDNVNPSRLYGDTGGRIYYKRSTTDTAWKKVLIDTDIVTSFPIIPLDTNAPSTKLVKDNLDLKLDIQPDGTHDLIDSNDNKVNTFYLPDYLLGQVIYGGTVNGSTAVATLSASAKSKLGTTDNTITLTNDTTAITGYVANEGIYYVVSTAGTFAGLNLKIGDWLISNGSAWEKVDNTDEVTSVNNKTGSVVLTGTDINLSSTDTRTIAEVIADNQLVTITLSGSSGTIAAGQVSPLMGDNCVVNYEYTADYSVQLRKATTQLISNKLHIFYEQDKITTSSNSLQGVRPVIDFNMTDLTWSFANNIASVEANGSGTPTAALEKLTVGSTVYSMPKGGIIDVTALPTTDINSGVIYRLTKDSWYSNGTAIDVTNAYYIDDTDYYVTDTDLVYLPVTEYAPTVIASLTNKTAIQNWLDANTSKWHYSSPNEISEWQSMVETADRFYGHNLTGSRSVNLFEHNGTSWNEVMTPTDIMLTDTPNTSEGSVSIVLTGGSTPNPDIIQDGQNYRYSTTKTSSNNYINTALDEIKTMAEGSNKTYFIEYPNTLPSAGNRSLNSYYYVQIASGGTNYTRWFIDSTDVARNLGTTQIALADFILKTAIVAPDSSSTNEQVASAKGVYDNTTVSSHTHLQAGSVTTMDEFMRLIMPGIDTLVASNTTVRSVVGYCTLPNFIVNDITALGIQNTGYGNAYFKAQFLKATNNNIYGYITIQFLYSNAVAVNYRSGASDNGTWTGWRLYMEEGLAPARCVKYDKAFIDPNNCILPFGTYRQLNMSNERATITGIFVSQMTDPIDGTSLFGTMKVTQQAYGGSAAGMATNFCIEQTFETFLRGTPTQRKVFFRRGYIVNSATDIDMNNPGAITSAMAWIVWRPLEYPTYSVSDRLTSAVSCAAAQMCVQGGIAYFRVAGLTSTTNLVADILKSGGFAGIPCKQTCYAPMFGSDNSVTYISLTPQRQMNVKMAANVTYNTSLSFPVDYQ